MLPAEGDTFFTFDSRQADCNVALGPPLVEYREQLLGYPFALQRCGREGVLDVVRALLEVQLCQKQSRLPLLRELACSLQDKNSVRVSCEESPFGTGGTVCLPSLPTKHSQATFSSSVRKRWAWIPTFCSEKLFGYQGCCNCCPLSKSKEVNMSVDGLCKLCELRWAELLENLCCDTVSRVLCVSLTSWCILWATPHRTLKLVCLCLQRACATNLPTIFDFRPRPVGVSHPAECLGIQRWRCGNLRGLSGRPSSRRRAPNWEASTWIWQEVLTPTRSTPTFSVCPRSDDERVSGGRSLCRGVAAFVVLVAFLQSVHQAVQPSPAISGVPLFVWSSPSPALGANPQHMECSLDFAGRGFQWKCCTREANDRCELCLCPKCQYCHQHHNFPRMMKLSPPRNKLVCHCFRQCVGGVRSPAMVSM